MKNKLFALTLVIALLAICFPIESFAANFSMDYFRYASTAYSIETIASENAAIVETTLPDNQMYLSHEYEHPSLYSSTRFDILVNNYIVGKPSGTLRLWITYNGTKKLNADSASFVFGGKEYKFFFIGDADRRATNEEGTTEELLLIFGGNEARIFLNALFDNFSRETNDFINPVTLILHGNEDLSINLDKFGFMFDFYAMMLGVSASNLSYNDCLNHTFITIEDYVQQSPTLDTK